METTDLYSPKTGNQRKKCRLVNPSELLQMLQVFNSNRRNRIHPNSLPLQQLQNATMYEGTSNVATGRLKSCLDEHIESTSEVVGCFRSYRHFSNFPRDEQVQLSTTCINCNM